MTDPDEVRDALARLARDDGGPRLEGREPAPPPDRTPGASEGGPADPELVVERAVDATADVERAAAYLADRDLSDLEAAVAALADSGEEAAAGRGRDALAAFRRFRDACEGDP